jgi:Na+/H+-dicarboxylate symporter
MLQALGTTSKTRETGKKPMPLAPFVVILAAADAAFIFGFAAMLSWQVYVVVVLATTALAAGAVFTVLEMRRLQKENGE